MPRGAIAYIAAVVCAGAAAVLVACWRWETCDPTILIGLAVLAILLSGMKIPLPRMTGTMAAGFVPVLAAVALLPWSAVVVIGCVSGVVQCAWRARVRPSAAQVLFNGAALSLSALAACQVAHFMSPTNGLATQAGVLGLAGATDYVVNSMLVAMVLHLIERKPVMSLFRNCNFWALPYYLLGVVIVCAMIGLRLVPSWPVVIPMLPLMWLVYDCYRRYVAVLAKNE